MKIATFLKNLDPRKRIAARYGLRARRLAEALDRRQDFGGASRINEVDRAFAVQQPMLRIEPQPRFVWIAGLGQSVHDVARVRNKELGFWVRKRPPHRPAKQRRRRNGGDIRDVASLKPASHSKIVDEGCDRTRHGERPITALILLDHIRFESRPSGSIAVSFSRRKMFATRLLISTLMPGKL